MKKVHLLVCIVIFIVIFLFNINRDNVIKFNSLEDIKFIKYDYETFLVFNNNIDYSSNKLYNGIYIDQLNTDSNLLNRYFISTDISDIPKFFDMHQNYMNKNELYIKDNNGSFIIYNLQDNKFTVDSSTYLISPNHFGDEIYLFTKNNETINITNYNDKKHINLKNEKINNSNTLNATYFKNKYYYAEDGIFYIHLDGNIKELDFNSDFKYGSRIFSIIDDKLIVTPNEYTFDFYSIDENNNIESLFTIDDIVSNFGKYLPFNDGKKTLVTYYNDVNNGKIYECNIGIIDLENGEFLAIDKPYNTPDAYEINYIDYFKGYLYISKFIPSENINNKTNEVPIFYDETLLIIDMDSFDLINEIEIAKDTLPLSRLIISY